VLNKLRRARLPLIGFCSSLALAATGTAWADAMHWENPGGPAWNGVYSSPYFATDQSNNQLMTLYCLDFNDGINPPADWQANLNLLSTSNLSQFQYGGSYPNASILPPDFTGDPGDTYGVTMQPGSDPYNRYLEAAWLFTNMIGSQTQSDPNNALV